MPTLKYKEIKQMSKEDREKRLKELKMELVKSSVGQGGLKKKGIKKVIARLMTFNTQESHKEVPEK